MGHVVRCLAIATGFRNRGIKPVFVITDGSAEAYSLIRRSDCLIESIPPTMSIEDDASRLEDIASFNHAKIIVTDVSHRIMIENPHQFEKYHCLLRRFFTVCVTNDTLLDIPADIVISPYVDTAMSDCSPKVRGKLLLGPSYFIFRRAFIAMARDERTIAKTARRLLVSVGGSDPLNLTGKILRAIRQVTRGDLTTRVFIGAGFTEQGKYDIASAIEGDRCSFELSDHDTDMAEAMLWTDLMVTGDGLTKYEAAVTGTPNIIVENLPSRLSSGLGFERRGIAAFVANVTQLKVNTISKKISDLLADVGTRQTMSKQGKALLDTKGLDRIMAHIPQEVLQ